ncbi:MAG: type IV pilus secretin PilQ [Myxococcales bacterium]|nr:type IV pilus secretin PilQ [Myxococcales bacterium]
MRTYDIPHPPGTGRLARQARMRREGFTPINVGVVGLLLLLGYSANATPPAPSASDLPEANQVEAINIRNGGRQVVIRTSSEPTYSLFRMTSPYRLLIDIAQTGLSSEVQPLTTGKGQILSVTPSSFDDGNQRITRVEIALSAYFPHKAKIQGNSIVLNIRVPKGTPAPVRSRSKPLGSTETKKVRPHRPQKTRIGRLVIHEDGDRSLLKAPTTGLDLGNDAVHLETLSSPSRLVIDLRNASMTPKWQRLRLDKYGVRRVRAAIRGEGVRIVLDLEDNAGFPQISVDVAKGALMVSIEASAAPPVARALAKASAKPRAKPAHAQATTSVRSAATNKRSPVDGSKQPSAKRPGRIVPIRNTIEDIRFEPKDGFYRLTIEFEKPIAKEAIVRQGSEDTPGLRLEGVRLPENYERTMDVSSIAGEALTSISSFADRGQVILAARILEETEHRHWQRGTKLMWDFRSRQPQVLSYETDGAAASYASTAIQTTGQLIPQRERYTGRRISLDLKDAEIQNVLRLLADVSKLNIVASDNVDGKITIKLRNVPWDQALDIILRAKQLDKTRNGNIIRVAPLEVLRQEEELRLKRAEARIKLEPLTVRLIPVSYAVASDVAPQVQSLLTSRGTINIDERTNVLIVEDIGDVLTKVERLVRTLDTQTPQVLIEARIVEARSNFSRELGVQWGGNAEFSQNYGNQTGLGFPSNVRVAGGADDVANQVTEGVLPNANYAVNLPAAVGSGGGGAIGFVFGSLDGGTLVNLRLSAAEATGKIKIVSAPKIVTLDNKKATILSGEQVPITVVTANGPVTRYINANIELHVLPHVTQDGSILMEIDAKKNELSDRIDFLGVPGILTKEAKTQMIVRDGDTAVLGGLYRRNTQSNEAYVPWLGRIPVLGWMFKTTSRSDARDELLIFISPRIVNRSEALITPD